MEKKDIPECDILVAIEFLEHLSDPERILKNTNAKELVFSVPYDSLATSTWHKYNFTNIGNIVTFFSRYYDIDVHDQYNKWVYGHGKRK